MVILGSSINQSFPSRIFFILRIQKGSFIRSKNIVSINTKMTIYL